MIVVVVVMVLVVVMGGEFSQKLLLRIKYLTPSATAATDTQYFKLNS